MSETHEYENVNKKKRTNILDSNYSRTSNSNTFSAIGETLTLKYKNIHIHTIANSHTNTNTQIQVVKKSNG